MANAFNFHGDLVVCTSILYLVSGVGPVDVQRGCPTNQRRDKTLLVSRKRDTRCNVISFRML